MGSVILSRSILLTWLPPEKPNGVIALYTIKRNGDVVDSVPGSVLSFNDTGLTPDTVYMYQIESENVAGSTVSESVSFKTLEGEPEGVDAPTLTVINSTSLKAEWVPPNVTNGAIASYNLVLVAVDNAVLESAITQFSGLAFMYVVTGLTPFSVNTFVLEVCTSQKCGSSEEVSATTAEAIPESQAPPTLMTINSTAIEISWSEPSQPNGVIVKYEIFQRNSPFSGNGFSVGNVSGDVLSFTVGDLQPFADYEFSVSSFTSIGGVQSDWTRVTTQEAGTQLLKQLSFIGCMMEFFSPQTIA